MITSKQRAYLRGLANTMETILQVGKSGVVTNVVEQVNEALAARELIKLRTLETCPQTPREAAQLLAERTHAEIIQVIGTRFVLYRRNEKDPKVALSASAALAADKAKAKAKKARAVRPKRVAGAKSRDDRPKSAPGARGRTDRPKAGGSGRPVNKPGISRTGARPSANRRGGSSARSPK